jgi:hypothetical protein
VDSTSGPGVKGITQMEVLDDDYNLSEEYSDLTANNANMSDKKEVQKGSIIQPSLPDEEEEKSVRMII